MSTKGGPAAGGCRDERVAAVFLCLTMCLKLNAALMTRFSDRLTFKRVKPDPEVSLQPSCFTTPCVGHAAHMSQHTFQTRPVTLPLHEHFQKTLMDALHKSCHFFQLRNNADAGASLAL